MKLTNQAIRFLIVGTLTNVTLYIAYLLITWFAVDHKSAMTVVYIAGVIIGFILNRNWTFRHHGHISHGFIRYSTIYATGYFVNLIGLYLLVDIAGYPHQIIQLLISILLAIIFFILLRLWVFRNKQIKCSEYVPEQETS